MVDLTPKVKRVDAIQSFVSQETPIVRIADADGATGTGYSYTIGTGGPAIMSLTILLFLWTWNQFLLPVVLVQDPMQRTMAGALGAFQGQWGTDIPLLCAGSLLILAPTVALFLAFQRQFVTALMQGAVKG